MSRNQLGQIVSKIQEDKLILFVGAGVSAHLGLPSLTTFVGEIASELDFEPDVARSLADDCTIAEFYKLRKGSLGPLLSRMIEAWHSRDIEIASSQVHKLIVKLRVKLIYTTNYDSWLERAHKHYGVPFSKIANVRDMALADHGSTRIVKFHGDFDDADTLVLTETSYFCKGRSKSVPYGGVKRAV